MEDERHRSLLQLGRPALGRAEADGSAGLCRAKESQQESSAASDAAFGFFCLLSSVKVAFFRLAEYLAVGIYQFASLGFFF